MKNIIFTLLLFSSFSLLPLHAADMDRVSQVEYTTGDTK